MTVTSRAPTLVLALFSFPFACADARVGSAARRLEVPSELVGQAEISRYALTQNRYGEDREGEAGTGRRLDLSSARPHRTASSTSRSSRAHRPSPAAG